MANAEEVEWFWNMESQEYGAETFGPFDSEWEARVSLEEVRKNALELGDGVIRSFYVPHAIHKNPPSPGDPKGFTLTERKQSIITLTERPAPKTRIFVEISGGCLQAVSCDADVECFLIDWDAPTADESEDAEGNPGEFPVNKTANLADSTLSALAAAGISLTGD